MDAEYVIVLTTWPTDGDAAEFGRILVGERLAACVNVLAAMQSVYAWEGKLEEETERQVVIKTTAERLEGLWARVRELHPYEVPEFLVLPIVDGNDVYLRWVKESTSEEPEPPAGGR